MLIRIMRPILRVFLLLLDRLYQAKRKPHIPPYPYDKRSNTISLPPEVKKEIQHIALAETKPKAVKKVLDLTGAGLKVSKDYVDSLLEGQRTDKENPR